MEDLSWTQEPPKVLRNDPLPKPHRGERKVLSDLPKHRELYGPPPERLNRELRWFIPGLAYLYLGLDRSIFELCAWARNQPVPVVSHISPVPLFRCPWGNAGLWFESIQGLTIPDTLFCVPYLESFEFRRSETERWVLRFESVTIIDPFNKLSPITVDMILPKRLGGDLCVIESASPGKPIVVGTEQCT